MIGCFDAEYIALHSKLVGTISRHLWGKHIFLTLQFVAAVGLTHCAAKLEVVTQGAMYPIFTLMLSGE